MMGNESFGQILVGLVGLAAVLYFLYWVYRGLWRWFKRFWLS